MFARIFMYMHIRKLAHGGTGEGIWKEGGAGGGPFFIMVLATGGPGDVSLFPSTWQEKLGQIQCPATKRDCA
jgi:hypothetical protein